MAADTATRSFTNTQLLIAAELVMNGQSGEYDMVQKLDLTLGQALDILDELERRGILGPHKPVVAREVLIPAGEREAKLAELREALGLPQQERYSARLLDVVNRPIDLLRDQVLALESFRFFVEQGYTADQAAQLAKL